MTQSIDLSIDCVLFFVCFWLLRFSSNGVQNIYISVEAI